MNADRWINWTAESLASEISRHNRAYWERASPTITDYEYDQMVERLRHLAPDHEVLSELGEGVPDIGSAVGHTAPMLSLDKAYDEKALLHWASKFEGDMVMSPKVDGVACSIRYEAGRLKVAATRGNGTVGEDITQNVLEIADVPRSLPNGPETVEIRGEVYLPLSAFEKVRDQLANPRNATAGALKQKNSDRVRTLGVRFFAYDVLGLDVATEIEKLNYAESWGFSTVERRLVDRQSVQLGYEDYVARRDDLDFEIDGVVFKVNQLSEHERLGVTAHHPRYAIAYKLQGDSGTTVLEDVEWSVSRTGVLTPVGLVAPVELSGAMVTRITLHHWGMVKAKNLSIGAQVVAMRRGGVIPHLEHVVTPGETNVTPPQLCPSCGTPVIEDGDLIRCPNSMACPAQSIGVLAHYAKAAGIEGFGDVWLETFVSAGLLRTPADFYDLTRAQLVGFDRMGVTLADKLLAEVAKARRVPLLTFLFALGIPEVGKSVAETIAEAFGDLTRTRQASVTQLLELPKVGPIVAKRFVEGIHDRSVLIDELLHRIDVTDHELKEPTGPQDFQGLSFLFTGTLVAMKRSEAQRVVKSRGGIAASGVSKSLTYLVVGDSGSAGSKLQKAKNAGVEVLSESDFLELLNR